ncbi:sortase [Tenggerimyces flavus]|uniref:Sortase n=1 Tax=Tenggerimyces flavus TaxID=1708749 RepID=A0ABV7YP74_9ACTN|nr:sortase [Tenggerimyces flavus]MBM7786453.1 sortase A [Tenggerimyces flavus]
MTATQTAEPSVVQVLLTLAALALWVVGYLVVIAPVQQDRAQQVLYSTFREQVALATAPIGGMIPPGAPVAVLEIPGVALREVVVEGTAASDLTSGPGHRRDTPLPGQVGVSILYGRGGTFGGPFGQVPVLRKGDRVTAVTGQGSFEYRVDGVRRTGDPLPQPLADGGARLTLVTAEGEGRFAEISRDETVYVDATLLDEAVPSPGGRPNLIPQPERAMQPDPSALVPLVLWLQALAMAMGLFVWARARWGRWQVWMVGAPVILALAWRATEYAAQLLPNLM